MASPNSQRRRESARRVTEKKQKFIWALKAASGCMICGESDPIVLEFHHRKPEDKHKKLKNRLALKSLSYAELAKEAEKCDVLCANCHRRLTHQERHSIQPRYR